MEEIAEMREKKVRSEELRVDREELRLRGCGGRGRTSS